MPYPVVGVIVTVVDTPLHEACEPLLLKINVQLVSDPLLIVTELEQEEYVIDIPLTYMALDVDGCDHEIIIVPVPLPENVRLFPLVLVRFLASPPKALPPTVIETDAEISLAPCVVIVISEIVPLIPDVVIENERTGEFFDPI